jgi:hypothetical protein
MYETPGWIIFGLGTIAFAAFCWRIIPQIKGKNRQYTVQPCICGRKAPSIVLYAGGTGGAGGFLGLYALLAVVPALTIANLPNLNLMSIPWYLWAFLILFAGMGLVPFFNFIRMGHSLLCSVRRGLLGTAWFMHYSHKH